MNDNRWEYEAPRFIDFEANEHQLCDNADEYFDKEDSRNSFPAEISDFQNNSAKNVEQLMDIGNLDSSEKQMKVEVTHFTEVETDTKQSEVPQSNTRDTFSMKTPARIRHTVVVESVESTPTLPHNRTRDTFCVETPYRITRSVSVKKDPSTTSANSLSSTSKQDSIEMEKPKILSNVMTPSRLASWKSVKTTFDIKKTGGTLGKMKRQNQSGLRRSLRKSSRAAAASANDQPPPNKKFKKDTPKVKMTVPAYSAIPHSHAHHKRHLTSEEREMAKIEELRAEARKKKEEGKKLLKKLENQTSHQKQLKVTKPQEFHFKTDERAAKIHSMSTRADTSVSSSDFVHELRKYAPSPVAKPKKTVIKPFHFSNERKRKHEDEVNQAGHYFSMAKAISDFHNRTPLRFKPSTKEYHPQGPVKPLRTTVPVTPHLSKPKPRPISTMSAKEQEEKELEEIKNYKFKAQPVDPSHYNPPQLPRSIDKKPPTVPHEFNLSNDRRSVHSDHLEHETELSTVFKAQPIPKAVLGPPKMLKKKSVDVTVPMSPAFALKSRIKAKVLVEDDTSSQPQKFYHPPPNPANAFVPVLESKKTEPQPFSFEERDKEKILKMEEKVKEIRKSASVTVEFKAQPMPIPHSPVLPPKQVKEPTKIEPFQHRCDERVAVRVKEWTKSVEDEVKQMREKATFHANKDYVKILKGKPWEPKLEHKPPTEPLNVVLHSDTRAREREEYQRKLDEEQAEKQKVLEDDQERREIMEQEKLAQLRTDLVHKAHNIRHFKNVKVTKSEKPLTVPESPKFSTRFNK